MKIPGKPHEVVLLMLMFAVVTIALVQPLVRYGLP